MSCFADVTFCSTVPGLLRNCPGFFHSPNMIDAWYIIVKAAEARDAYEDLEVARPDRRDEYAPIAQFDHTYQTAGVRDGAGENPTYADMVAGSASQPKPNATSSSDAPPSYSAVVKGGMSSV